MGTPLRELPPGRTTRSLKTESVLPQKMKQAAVVLAVVLLLLLGKEGSSSKNSELWQNGNGKFVFLETQDVPMPEVGVAHIGKDLKVKTTGPETTGDEIARHKGRRFKITEKKCCAK